MFKNWLEQFKDYRIEKLKKRVKELEINNSILFEMLDEKEELIESLRMAMAINSIERAKK